MVKAALGMGCDQRQAAQIIERIEGRADAGECVRTGAALARNARRDYVPPS
jgi:hypothetical protein